MESHVEERFPHIVAHLTEVWPDGEKATGYLDDLLFTEKVRPGRHGFDPDIWMELQFLNDLLRIEYPPRRSPLAIDVWAETASPSSVG
jgi:hypothetical protein